MEHAAATAFSNIVMSRLLKIDKRYKMMKDLKSDTESIIDELDMLSAHMDDELIKRRDAPRTAVAREYSKKMRDWTHDMEDCIERFLHPVTCKEGASRIRRAAHRVKTFRSRYRFATRIKKLKKRLEEARDRIEKLPGSDQFSALPAELNPPRRGSESDPVGRKLPGMEEPMGDLLALLEDQQQEQQLRVISIVGFGGSGKTTLARAVYDDTDVVGKFPCRAWVAVRSLERSDATGILRCIQQKLLPDKRSLVVIDGIGDIEGEQWGTITSIVENNCRGSRIIVTTTFRPAANRNSDYVYKMRSLGNEYCMEIALGKRRTQELVEGSTTLLKKCDGLPLALVSVANQLKSEDEPTGLFCAKLCRRLGSYLEREVDDEPNFARLRGVLADNYTGLSNHTVRSCLLYLCIFPNDRPLRRNVVIRRWSAEGYARSEDPYSSNLEVADANFDTFINWNIIQPVATSYNEVTKACKTQGIMHEFLLQKSISEKFIVSPRGPSLKKVRHLSVHDTSCTKTLDMDLSRVRSLTVSGSAGDAISGFGKYKLMRVLDLEECSDVNDDHLKDICKLWNLRYLSLGARITMLPKEIAKLKLLETLHLSKTTVNVLPVEVIGLPCLIHLIGKFKLPDQEPVNSELEQLSKGSNLETLAGYVVSDQSQVFPQLMVHMKKLRKVKIWCEFTGGSGSNSTDHLSRAIQKYMMAHDDVRSLSIDFQKCSEQPPNFLHSLEAPSYLQIKKKEAPCYLRSLKLHGELPSLPPFVACAKYLRQLCLSSTTLTQDVLSAVSNLENLLYLKLMADHLENLVIRVGAFQILRRLRFVVRGPNPILPEIQDRALPELVSLQLICEHLAGLSNIEITHLTSLKEVTLDSRVTTETRGAWEAAARNHPKRPNVLLFEMVNDPTGNATENPVAAPEEAAPDQTAMQGQIAEEGSETPAVHMNSAAQPSPRDSKTSYIEKLFQRNPRETNKGSIGLLGRAGGIQVFLSELQD